MTLIKWAALPTAFTNAAAALLAAYTQNVPVLAVGLGGFAAALYGWCTYMEESDMAESRFLDVAMRLRWELKEEGYVPGDRFPSNEELAKRCGVTRSTLRKALKVLEEEGLVQQVHGRGTFVLGENNSKGRRKDRPRDAIEYDLRNEISQADPGQSLPTTAQLMAQYSVSHPTVRRVQLKLVDEGLMYRTRGGRYIRK